MPVGWLILTIALSSPLLNNNLLSRLLAMSTNDFASEKIYVADSELESLMSKLDITPDSSVTYYGNARSMPRLSGNTNFVVFENTWLPNPLQLLEEPITDVRRDEIISRWVTRHPNGGFLVHKLGEADDRFASWINLLTKFFLLVEDVNSDHYRILLFKPY